MSYILTIIGARPQFIKAAVVSKALSDLDIEERIIHTGQHYDHNMSTIFWEELGIPAPTVNLQIGSGNHGEQTGNMLTEIEKYIFSADEKPSGLLIYGDTNSTLAGALVASKLHIPVIHVEAGLRSFNKKMPEEINRIMTDHISDLLFCSSDIGVDQLKKEGITDHVHNVGDVMYDALLTFSEIASQKVNLGEIISLPEETFYLATIHRPSNTDSEENLNEILKGFSQLDKDVLWPVHPRNKKKLSTIALPENLHLIEPVSYLKMMTLLQHCSKVITDSGGLQKEAYWMKKQCITIREETEWIETLRGNWNTLTGANTNNIIKAVQSTPSTPWESLYGEGTASDKIATTIKGFLN
ncbi:MAG: UDP-N-acetylglucosamine 2-epimerase (non-hydrolyzing) [Balneola sp.]